MYKIENAEGVKAVFRSSLPRSKDENVFFPPCPRDRLVKIAKLPSLSPIMDMKIIMLKNNRPQLYLATGRGPASSFKICNQALDVQILKSHYIKEKFLHQNLKPDYLWIIERKYVCDSKLLFVASFWSSTVVYYLDNGIFHEYQSESFQLSTNTLLCVGIRKNTILQVCPEGACIILKGVNRIFWNEAVIVDCVVNNSCLVLATENKDIIYFVLYPGNEDLVITPQSVSKKLEGHIICMSIAERTENEQLLAVGISLSEYPCETKYTYECKSPMHEIHLFKLILMGMDIVDLFKITTIPYCLVSLFFQTANEDFTLLIGDKVKCVAISL
ncbi:CPSF_A domain-containing protein [Trichonephila clavata]|uniref:CPSF_A domain-containing protein n=1 Tax=Trichonephila clavata TaxID=2740835 RepID=A0A8X6FLS3_TRICU|nr:CPSF_A domain-containing protein [Trichonephila clavata]